MEVLGWIAIGSLAAILAVVAVLLMGPQISEEDIKPSTGQPYWEDDEL